MPVFVALYRGINVGGKTSVKMDALRAMHERAGHEQVRNYIQSGNIVFVAKGTAAALGRELAQRFAQEFGFAARVVVVPAKQWGTLVAANPFYTEALWKLVQSAE